MYYTGRGVRKSVSKAAKFYKTGCDGKSGAACANLAQMYIQGDGVRVDRARAEQLLRRACDLGHNRAC
jgi:TPR repeat protein